jgi:hypothetical protein
MAFLIHSDVNTWLEQTKLQLAEEDIKPGVDEVCRSRVFGRLATRYDTTTWTNRTTSPVLVVQLVAMLYAAETYREHYAEDLEGQGVGLNWAEWLETTVEGWLVDLTSGTVTLPDFEDVATGDVSGPVFYPNDTSTLMEESPIMFSVGMTF